MNPKIPLCAALLGALAVLQPHRIYVVSGDSMSPTFHSGELVVGSLRPSRISRGDVVVFRHGDETCVKRVAFLPGDRIERFFYLGEWQLASGPRVRAASIRHQWPRRSEAVPTGRFYALSDNLPGSIDSRTYGTVPLSNVIAVLPAAYDPHAPTITGESGPTFVARR